MYCDACGTALQSGQRFCSRCGKTIVGAGLEVRRSRVREHIRLLGILWVAYASIHAAGAFVLALIARSFLLHNPGMAPSFFSTPTFHTLLNIFGIIAVAKAALGFVVGWGLLRREPWARLLVLVLGFLLLFNVPFGTALGIYTLWVLLPADSEREYREDAQRVAA